MVLFLVLSLLLSPCLVQPVWAEQAGPTELFFKVALWADEVRDRGDFDLNPDGVFQKGQRAYAYLELEGFGLEETPQGYLRPKVHIDVGLRTRWGLRLFYEEDLLEFDSLYLEAPSDFWFYIWVDIPWWAPRGVYRTEITVRDEVKNEILLESREIEVR